MYSGMWVKLNKFAELTGYTPNAAHCNIKKGIWLEGVMWCKASNGKIHVNLDNYNKWVQGWDQHEGLNLQPNKSRKKPKLFTGILREKSNDSLQ